MTQARKALADRLETECIVRDNHPDDYCRDLTKMFRECVAALRDADDLPIAARLPLKLTGELACILENCSRPDKQTPEAVAALIEGYQPTWDKIVTTLAAAAAPSSTQAQAPVAWRWRTRREDNWTFSLRRLACNDIGRTSEHFEEQPLYAAPIQSSEGLDEAALTSHPSRRGNMSPVVNTAVVAEHATKDSGPSEAAPVETPSRDGLRNILLSHLGLISNVDGNSDEWCCLISGIDTAADAILAALPPPAGQWQDIGVAPKDTDVLMAWWDSHEGRWKIDTGLAGSTKGRWLHGRATHWQPLPAPPHTRPNHLGDQP